MGDKTVPGGGNLINVNSKASLGEIDADEADMVIAREEESDG